MSEAEQVQKRERALISGIWVGLVTDGSYALRDISNEEIYALDVKFP